MVTEPGRQASQRCLRTAAEAWSRKKVEPSSPSATPHGSQPAPSTRHTDSSLHRTCTQHALLPQLCDKGLAHLDAEGGEDEEAVGGGVCEVQHRLVHGQTPRLSQQP